MKTKCPSFRSPDLAAAACESIRQSVSSASALNPRPTGFASLAVLSLLLCFASGARSETTPALLDDFSDANRTSFATARVLLTDKVACGKSSINQKSGNGALSVEGELSPPRGAPAWANLILPLASVAGETRDLSAFSGVRIRIKNISGTLALQVSCADVQNFDFHNAPIPALQGGGAEVRIPFSKLKRSWSEQTLLDLKKITSVNLLAVGVAQGRFAYVVDEIGFY